MISLALFARLRRVPVLALGDVLACGVPFGLFFGRIANFINGELWGKATSVSWAMVFPRASDQLPRHPSQLYEAGMEGILLFAIMQLGLRRFHLHDRPGLLAATFFAFYGLFRYIAEMFRDSDTVFPGWLSVGQALSIPMWIAAALLFWLALRRPAPRAAA
jgi:phosphatidylglycerol:prolipoprotein diacylglycerol transferase